VIGGDAICDIIWLSKTFTEPQFFYFHVHIFTQPIEGEEEKKEFFLLQSSPLLVYPLVRLQIKIIS
jgi:hypothetical protein